MVKYGLKSIQKGDHPGVIALMKKAGVDQSRVTSTTIGFYIGPRINAAGRMDSPDHAFELLLGKIEKADTLQKLNIERQKVVEKALEEAKEEIINADIPPIILLKSEGWSAGILGLIAGKICDTFHRPTIAMQVQEENVVASCRSLNEFDITSFLREVAGDLFASFGGHMLAGGFTLPKENLEEFLGRVSEKAKGVINPNDFKGNLEIDCELRPEDFEFETRQAIDKLEPFGQGNPEPMFMVKNVKLLDIKPVGSKGEHLQFPIQCGDKKVKAIAFRFGEHLDKIVPNTSYDIAFNLEINEWNGYKNLQMRVVDMRNSE